MKLTPEQLRQNAAAMIAFADGKPIEWYDGVEWLVKTDLSYITAAPHRPKPESKTRPWSKPEDVPGPVCWLRIATKPFMVLGFSEDGIQYAGCIEGILTILWKELFKYEYSTDRKTWHPCVVTEE